ncbi:ABC transporter permease [Alphaproteobacteria bacterium]|nr:ABC transporter permease [Alphaproteobacteria bacterium]MDA9816119.1 ABC transporter permease [Alphaproteobacteria bacterium]MDC3311969.1 ABC transporter permease [Alphaproteobacteria bacterium]
MQIFSDSFTTAFFLIISGDPDLYEIIFLSIKVSLTSLLGSIIIGLPVGAFLAIHRFKMRSVLLSVLNALMGMPPVVVGLIVYLYLSRSGPLGFLSLLYSPTAMIIAQMLLVTPIIAALSAQIIEDLHIEYKDLFRSLNVSTSKAVVAYIIDARMSLLTVVLAGFGRAISEVGAVSIVGGNIDHLTRVMTTAIALETSKGNLSLALALGIILLTIALGINLLAAHAKNWVMEKQDG